MSVDADLLETLMSQNENHPLNFTLKLNNLSFQLISVSITNSPIPVNEPTTRGGVYFSDTFAYKMKGVVEDLSIVPLLTKKMLGPNTEFGELIITTQIDDKGKPVTLEIFTNLTNSVQTPNSIELSMIIVKLNSI
ncbi:hypothetical protein [Nitrosopumilus adriaticus]|uniref:Uncharacterized protein n=1 Tax=Nitrosopumilus adriaticus TaxID=1580092 RepID=A0A0D5C2P9_9ARCH|nr:hypothetical protein [Nitrosopumilus adriaticus]AJW71079.1 hypothetical protein NADRNF5_1394 [Nitrosopumilus adriaticus]